MEYTVAELLRRYRQREGLTLSEMARRCGVTAQYLHSVEAGGDPATGRTDAILKQLGLSLELGDVDGPSVVAEVKKRRMRVS